MNYPYYNNYFQPQRQELIRVNGLEGAKNYPLSPGSTVALFDADSDTMFIKSMDAGGFPSIRTFSFMETTSKPTDTTETRLSAIEEEIASIKEVLNGIKLEGNEIVIYTPGSYLIGVSVTAAQTSTTTQGVRLLVSTPSGVTVQSEGGSASSSDATAGNVRTLAFTDTVRVCKNNCCQPTRLSLLATGAMTVSNIIVTVARID